MKKIVKIRCGTCHKFFLPKSQKNVYCKRSCFKKAYYHHKKAEELKNIKFPILKCPLCSRNIELDFDPIVDDNRWLNFKCPFCHVLMINVCEEIITQDTSNV